MTQTLEEAAEQKRREGTWFLSLMVAIMFTTFSIWLHALGPDIWPNVFSMAASVQLVASFIGYFYAASETGGKLNDKR